MSDGRVVIDILGDDADFQRAVKGLGASVDKGLRNASKVGGVVAGIAGLIAGIAIKGGIERALSIENARAKLKGLGYDLATIEKVTESAINSVTDTAFTLDEAMGTAVIAMAAGIKEGKELEGYLRATADAAAHAQVPFEEMGHIFNKVQSIGRLTGESVNELEHRAIPIIQWLADSYGVSAEEMRKMVSRGEVDAGRFRRAIEENIGGAALAAGETTTGAWQNTIAALEQGGAALVDSVLPPVRDLLLTVRASIKDAVPHIKEFGEALAAFIGSIDVKWFYALAGVIGGFLVAALLAAAEAAIAFVAPMLPIIAVAGLVGIAIKGLIDRLGGFEAVKDTVSAFFAGFRGDMDAIEEVDTDNLPIMHFGMKVGTSFDEAKDGVSGFVAGFTGDMEAIESLDPSQFPIMNLGMDLRRSFDGLIEFFQPTIDMLRTAFASLWEALGPTIGNIIDGLESLWPVVQFVGAVIGVVFAAALQVVAAAINGISVVIEPLSQMFKGLAAIIGSAVELVVAVLEGRWQDAWDAAEAGGQGVIDFFTGAVNRILAPVSQIADGAVEAFEWLRDRLGGSIVPGLVADVVKWFTGLPGRIASSLSRFVSDVSAKFTEAYNRMRDALSQSAIGRVFSALLDTVTNIPKRFTEMRDKIVGAINELISRLRAPIDSVISTIGRLNPFMRHSPSLVDNVLAGTKAIRDAYESVSGMRLDRPEFIGSSAYSPSLAPAGALAGGAGGTTTYIQIGDVSLPANDPEAQSTIADFVRLVRRYQRMGPTGG